MNEDRRQTGHMLVALLLENDGGMISDETHVTLTNVLHHLQRKEFHQLRTQEKYDGTSASNTKQVAICRIALGALDKAVKAWDNDEHAVVISSVLLAVETDGTAPATPKARRTRRKARA